MKLLNCTFVLLSFTAAFQMILFLSVHIDLAASEQTITGNDDGAATLSLDEDKMTKVEMAKLSVEPAVKRGKRATKWRYVKGAGNTLKVFLQVLFSATAVFSIWQQLSISVHETFRLVGKGNKTSETKMLDEYISQLKSKSVVLKKPEPDPTTEEPVFAFFRNNFIASCVIFVIVNIALIMFMWRTSKERALERQLKAHQMQDVIVLAGRTDKRRSEKRKRNKNRERKKNDH